MRVAILGPTGNLGSHLCRQCTARGHEVFPVARAVCQLAEPTFSEQLRLKDLLSAFCADLVVNCAAFTDVDGAEEASDQAFLVNALGARMVANAARDAGARLVHISTDFVFDGRLNRPYDEFDAVNPQSVYARSKWAGEQLVRAASPDCIIVRVGGLYGRGGRNFASLLLSRLQGPTANSAGGEKQPKLLLDAERLCAPTWSGVLAQQIVTLAEHAAPGLYHAGCQGETTWFGFAQALCEEAAALGWPLATSFQGVATAVICSRAQRPAQSVLDCRMLRLTGLLQLPHWRVALRDYLLDMLPHR